MHNKGDLDMTTTQAQLKKWQAARGLHARQAAGLMGVPLATYRRWVQGTRKPGAASQAWIARVIGESQPTNN